MDCLLDRYHIPKLNQDQVSKIRPKNYKDIEAAIKTLPTKKKAKDWMVIVQSSTTTSKKS